MLFTITGGPGLGMNEVNEAAKVITASADEEAKVIFGAVVDEQLKDEIKITVIATGFDNQNKETTQSKKEEYSKSYTPSSFIEEEQKKDLMSSSSYLDEDTMQEENPTEQKEEKGAESDVAATPAEEEAPTQEAPAPENSEEDPPKRPTSNLDQNEGNGESEDELGVPAFIRRKMK